MTRKAATGVGHTARLALLLATALGLALMHTLGHTGVRADPHPAMAGMPTMTAGAAGMMGAVVTAAQPCPDGHCDGHGGHSSGVWSACLAILSGLAVIVMLLWLLTTVRGHRLVSVPAELGAVSPRAPPDRTTGLMLASAAVLRI
ncbi:DUF6153 family protein [Solwaraspora sp. WMMD791]|uniref:DUF6153 family protein n=1 Tax=Solwaraspora sp. WMMD791 TaxID=3016086 RepID=UPI00249B5C4E|nr:DUF6153 family protein [Solwaraspora sp. WMMD791]WFE26103.1 DUF6153 family protein [Solwaraspora sp. WMMD791]